MLFHPGDPVNTGWCLLFYLCLRGTGFLTVFFFVDLLVDFQSCFWPWPPQGQAVKYRNRVRGLVVCEVCLSLWCSCCRLGSRYSIHLRAPHARCNGVFGHDKGNQMNKLNYCSFRFPNISPLELWNKYFGLKIQIICEISFLKPAPKVWKSKSRSKSLGLCFVSRK